MKSIEELFQKFLDNMPDLEFKASDGGTLQLTKEMNDGWRIYKEFPPIPPISHRSEYILFRPNPIKDVELEHTAEVKATRQDIGMVVIEGHVKGVDFRMECPDLLTMGMFRKQARMVACAAYDAGYHRGMDGSFEDYWERYGVHEPNPDAPKPEKHTTTLLTFAGIESTVMGIAFEIWGEDVHPQSHVCDDREQENKFRLALERKYGLHFEEDWLKIGVVSDAIEFIVKFHGILPEPDPGIEVNPFDHMLPVKSEFGEMVWRCIREVTGTKAWFKDSDFFYTHLNPVEQTKFMALVAKKSHCPKLKDITIVGDSVMVHVIDFLWTHWGSLHQAY